jgi:2-deoxy-D-gluconate 3-dehydrogenase
MRVWRDSERQIRSISDAGAGIAVVGRNDAKSKAAAAELAARGITAIAVVADVTDKAAVAGMVERVSSELGRIDPSSTMPASTFAKPRIISSSRTGLKSSTPI